MTSDLKEQKKQAQRRKLIAEAKLAEQQARQAAADADVSELAAQEAIKYAARKGSEDSRNHVYQFAGSVGTSSAANARAVLSQWDRQDPDADWTIVFNSPGGSVIDGMALFDDIVAHSIRGGGSHMITTKVRGYAASMGGILLQAGDVRVCGPESYILIHEVSSGAGGKIGEIEDEVKFLKHVCERVLNLFVARSGGKISKAAFRRNWARKDWWLDADEAVKLGIVDDIG